MPERMGMDMRQIMAAGKVIELSGDAVIVRREYKSGVLTDTSISPSGSLYLKDSRRRMRLPRTEAPYCSEEYSKEPFQPNGRSV